MSTTATRTGKRGAGELETWGHPEAPYKYDKGRECQVPLARCATASQTGKRGKLNRYATPLKGGILLCEACQRFCARQGIEPHKLIGPVWTETSAALVAEEDAKKPGARKTAFLVPRLQEIREREGMSRARLAATAACSHRTIAMAECSSYEPSAALAGRWAAALGVDVDELKGEE